MKRKITNFETIVDRARLDVVDILFCHNDFLTNVLKFIKVYISRKNFTHTHAHTPPPHTHKTKDDVGFYLQILRKSQKSYIFKNVSSAMSHKDLISTNWFYIDL